MRIIEMTGIGPAPYAAMLLTDMGAIIIRIDCAGGYTALGPTFDFAAWRRHQCPTARARWSR